MCLPNFIEYKQIEEASPIIGYRNWKNYFEKPLILVSEYQNYNWSKVEGPHKVTKINSGIYAYNNNYNNYYDNYYDNNYYNYYYYYYYDNCCNLQGIIHQWGKVAIHKTGQRSEYAKIEYLFSIRELDAKGSINFLNWIKEFNSRIEKLAKVYECKVITLQDFVDKNIHEMK